MHPLASIGANAPSASIAAMKPLRSIGANAPIDLSTST
jgi:hypothetical protein